MKMLILILLIIICFIIVFCCNDSGTTSNSDSNLTLDVDRMYKDSVDVTLGKLSEAEKKRRMKSGYYLVPKGQEYSRIDELRKKRIQRWKDQGYLK